VIRDVTDEHWRTQKLKDAALLDPLTGIHNRRGFEQYAEALQSRPRGAPTMQAVIMADIDHFKRVNDTFGHDAGDDVLKAVASALQGTARDGDILARFGGEEFVLLLPDATATTAMLIAERLRSKVEALRIEIAGQELRVTASFGVAQQVAGEAQSVVLARADAALYRAKHEGRNRVSS
jgi:diguanylate cyclase (GGDEF)-like protein